MLNRNKSLWNKVRNRSSLAAAALLGAMAASAHAQTFLQYGFDDGTLQGWTIVSGNTNEADGETFVVATQFGGTGNDLSLPQSGAYALFENSFADRDTSTAVCWARSPQFQLNGAGDLTLYLIGGTGDTTDPLPTNQSQVPATATLNGFLFVALRDVATGNFVLTATDPGGDPYPAAWALVDIPSYELAGLDQTATYTLDLIDARYVNGTAGGGWGWMGMDTVSIPGSVPVAPPVLTIQNWTNGMVRISWPATTSPSYLLQSSATVAGGYANSSLSVGTEGSSFAAYDVVTSAQFYRLAQ